MSAVASSPAAVRRRVYQNRLQRMLNSSIGLKITIALTGVILSGFVLVHMLGNLQVYQGAEALDAYGKLLRKEPALLWTFRLVLLSAVGLHIWAYCRPDCARTCRRGRKPIKPESTRSRASPRGR